MENFNTTKKLNFGLPHRKRKLYQTNCTDKKNYCLNECDLFEIIHRTRRRSKKCDVENSLHENTRHNNNNHRTTRDTIQHTTHGTNSVCVCMRVHMDNIQMLCV